MTCDFDCLQSCGTYVMDALERPNETVIWHTCQVSAVPSGVTMLDCNRSCSSFILPVFQIGGGQTINTNLLKVAVGVIEESRLLRLQPFNEYRKRFSMKPYKSFQELTGQIS